MLHAAFFILLTGLAWTTISISQASARHHNGPPEMFFVIGSATMLAVAVAWSLFSPAVRCLQWSWLVFICTALAAAVNSIANFSTMINVGYGSAALYLALSSLGIVVSFLWSVIVWGEPISPCNILGMACILTAIVLSSAKKRGNQAGATAAPRDLGLVRRRLALACCSTVSCGICQILLIYPYSANFNSPPLPTPLKLIVIGSVYILIYAPLFRLRRSRYTDLPSVRAYLPHAMLWGVLAVISYSFLFAALKYMGEIGRTGLTYPIGGALQIFFFALACRVLFRDRLSPIQIIALILIVIGIFAVQM